MNMNKHRCFIIFMTIILFYCITISLLLIKTTLKSPFHVSLNRINHTQIYNKVSSCIPAKRISSKVKFYKLSSNRFYHYEYRYELTKHNLSSTETRLILLLAGHNRACVDWWDFSTGEIILSQMRSSGFSILAICTLRRTYEISVPIQKNLDVYWIYTTLQIWMNDVYHRHFQHYPRLYLFGISRGSQISSLLCRVLPVQAQILYISPGHRPSLLMHSDYEKSMQNRLITDHTFANWFYFDYCLKVNLSTTKQCPFHHQDKNYFNPVSPIYFVHHNDDTLYKLSNYNDIISDLKKDAILLGGKLLTHNDTFKLDVVHPLTLTPDYMREKFNRWNCKSWSSHFFYEHFINSTYHTRNPRLRTCWCNPTNFIYFDQYPEITKTWSETKQKNYRDYVKDIKRFKTNFCETVCGEIMAKHSMSSRNIENTLSWLNDMDHQRSLYKIEDFLNRPLRLWMYNKSDIIHNVTYLTYQTPMNSSCGRYYHAKQMYSPEYFLFDYFQRLKDSYPFSRHKFIWAKDPLLADYYIIPHDYICIDADYYRSTVTDSEYRSFSIHLNQDYLLPLLTNVRTRFPYWNMTSGSNHIIAFTVGRNAGIIRNNLILDILKNVIQLGFTGLRQDLLPRNSSPLYVYRTGTPFYRHNYDIILPPFNRLQWINDKPVMIDSYLDVWYKKKKYLLFFAGTMNNSLSTESARRRLSLLNTKDVGEGKRYRDILTIDGKQLNTIVLIDGLISPTDYVESIRSSIFNLCPEGFSPWSPRLYESICFGAIPVILAESIVLPFERFIDWRSFSMKMNVNNVTNIIDLVRKINHFEDYVKQKLRIATTYFHAFRWPYSPINNKYDRHLFLPEEDLNGTLKNVFHYLSLELRCRRLEQFYGFSFDTFSIKSGNARRQACRYHPTICPCYEEKTSLAIEEYI